jgi:hypothetical protein
MAQIGLLCFDMKNAWVEALLDNEKRMDSYGVENERLGFVSGGWVIGSHLGLSLRCFGGGRSS